MPLIPSAPRCRLRVALAVAAAAFLVPLVSCTAGSAALPDPVQPAVSAVPTVPHPELAAQPTFPIRAAFYYPWFPEGWVQQSLSPYTRYQPSLGRYDSGDRETIAAQLHALAYGHFQAAIVSWWGQGQKSEATRVPALLAAAAEVEPALRFAIYYEKEGRADPPVDELVRDLAYVRDRYAAAGNYLRVGGRPVIFVYNANDQDCSVVDRWAAASAAVNFYVVLKVFHGSKTCPQQPNGWHEYAPAQAYISASPKNPAVTGSVSISPGFWRAEDGAAVLERDLGRWRSDVATMVRSGAAWQLVTTFNEWGEGTAVESAAEWASASGVGTYLDVLHDAVP